MSHNDWERGEFKLPTAEFARFRQTVQDVDAVHKEQVFNLTQQAWKGMTRKQQTDPTAYREAVEDFRKVQIEKLSMRSPGSRHNGYVSNYSALLPDEYEAITDATHALDNKVRTSWENGRTVLTGSPSRVLKSDIDFPTNRSTDFDGDECSVSFDKDAKTVTWSVSENNHAVEGARRSHLGRAFFAHLDTVRWTHGTGGVLVGNDEYNEDSRDVGGGANYCTGAYGYLGIQQAPTDVRPFVNAKGQRVTCETKLGKYGFVGKAVHGPVPPGGAGVRRQPAGVPVGGQFAATRRGSSSVKL